MRTTKPVATISFNTENYLQQKLQELQKAGILSFWCFIKHQPEDDEGGKKEHFHVFCEPSKMIQTDELKEALKEFDPSNPSKPLGTISWGHSKFPHWYLYALHNREYLLSKSESRKYHYTHEMIVSSDEDDLRFRAKTINLLEVSPYSAMIDAINSGVTWEEYFSRGTVPLPQLNAFKEAFLTLCGVIYKKQQENLDRGRSNPHAYMDNDGNLIDPNEENKNE